MKTPIIFKSLNEVCKQSTFRNVKRDNRCRENTDSDYALRVLLVSGVKPDTVRTKFVRFCSIGRKSNSQENRRSILFDCRTQSNTNRSIKLIGFLFDFVRLDGSSSLITNFFLAQLNPSGSTDYIFKGERLNRDWHLPSSCHLAAALKDETKEFLSISFIFA